MTFKAFLNKTSGALVCTLAYPIMTALSIVIILGIVLPVRVLHKGFKFTLDSLSLILSSFWGSLRGLVILFGVIFAFYTLCEFFNTFYSYLFKKNNLIKLLISPFSGCFSGWSRGLKALIEYENIIEQQDIDFLDKFFGIISCIILYPVLTVIEFACRIPLLFIRAIQNSIEWLVRRFSNPAVFILLTPVVAVANFLYNIGKFIVIGSIISLPLFSSYQGFKHGLYGLLTHPLIKFLRPLPRQHYIAQRHLAEILVAEELDALRLNQMNDQIINPLANNNWQIPINPQPFQQVENNNYAKQNAELLVRIAQLLPPIDKPQFLSAEEINAFKTLIDHETNTTIKQHHQEKLSGYEQDLRDNSCSISKYELHEMKEPITVKRVDTQSKWIHVYDKAHLLAYIEYENNSRHCVAKDTMTRQPLTDREISLSAGVDPELTQKINQTAAEIRAVLQKAQQPLLSTNATTLFPRPPKAANNLSAAKTNTSTPKP